MWKGLDSQCTKIYNWTIEERQFVCEGTRTRREQNHLGNDKHISKKNGKK